MWSHYCAKHQGIVIGLDSSHECFQKKPCIGSLQPVEYVRKRVPYHTDWPLRSSPEIADFEDKMTFSKNNEWSYEMEIRQKFDLNSLSKRSMKDGSTGYFFAVPADAILTVSLGVNCQPKIERRIRALLKRPHFCKVKLDRAALHKSKFELTFMPLEPAPQSKRDLDGAVADQTKAIQLNPDNAGAYYNRGVAKQTKGDFEGAIADYTKAIQLNPDNREAYDQRGIAKKAKGDLEGAIADHIKAAQLKPSLFG